MKFTFLLLQTSTLAIGNIRPGNCPDIPNQPDFDVTRYIGQWHNYLANDKKNIPDNAECTTATYDVLNDRQITVNNSVALMVERRGETFPILSWAYGEATIVDPEYPTQLWVNLYEFGGCGRNAVLCGGTGGKPDQVDTDGDEIYENYRVAQTDYENYTIVISCYPGPEENTHSEITYLMTRDRQWGPNNRVKVEELLETIRSWGINIDDLHETKQTGCDYGLIP